MFIRTAVQYINKKISKIFKPFLDRHIFCRENKPKYYFDGVNAAILLFMFCRNPF